MNRALSSIFSRDLEGLEASLKDGAGALDLLEAAVSCDFTGGVKALLGYLSPSTLPAALIFLAAENDSASAVELLASASPSLLTAQDRLLRTPLHVAVAHAASSSSAALLKAAGAQSPPALLLETADDRGRLPLDDHYLALAGDGLPRLAQVLLPFLASASAVSKEVREKLEAAASGAPPPVLAVSSSSARLARNTTAYKSQTTGREIFIPGAALFAAANSLIGGGKGGGAAGRPSSARPKTSDGSSSSRLRTHQSEQTLAAVAELTGDGASGGSGGGVGGESGEGGGGPITGILDPDLLLALIIMKFQAAINTGLCKDYNEIFGLLDSAGEGDCTSGDFASGCLAMGVEVEASILPAVLERMHGRSQEDEGADTISEDEFVLFCELAQTAAENAAKQGLAEEEEGEDDDDGEFS